MTDREGDVGKAYDQSNFTVVAPKYLYSLTCTLCLLRRSAIFLRKSGWHRV